MGTPPHTLGHKVLESLDLGLDLARKVLISGVSVLQSIPSKWVRFYLLQEQESPGGCPGLFVLSISSIAKWMELLCHVNLHDSMRVMRLWGLTVKNSVLFGMRLGTEAGFSAAQFAKAELPPVEMTGFLGWDERTATA